jgi:mannose/fructose/N-acetylgalactosamine-specific phosphotransferase system component IIC
VLQAAPFPPLVDSAVDALPLGLLGALLGLDVVSFPQAMISRPLVASTLAGALVGQPLMGLLIGATLECFALETLPFGASRYPEWGSAAVVGGALFGSRTEDVPGALTTAVVAALATAWIGGFSMIWLRKLNARWARARLEQLQRGSYRTVVSLQVAGLTMDVVRGFALTWLMLVLARPAMGWALMHWSVPNRVSRAVVVGAAAMVAAGAAWKVFHGMAGARWFFLGGIATGLLLLALR